MQLFLPTHNVEERLRHEKQIGTHIVDNADSSTYTQCGRKIQRHNVEN